MNSAILSALKAVGLVGAGWFLANVFKSASAAAATPAVPTGAGAMAKVGDTVNVRPDAVTVDPASGATIFSFPVLPNGARINQYVVLISQADAVNLRGSIISVDYSTGMNAQFPDGTFRSGIPVNPPVPVSPFPRTSVLQSLT